MTKIVISAVAALSLHGGSCDPQNIVGEVAKLRQKYEECRQGQSVVQGIDPKLYRQVQLEKGTLLREAKEYRTRIQILERELSRLQTKTLSLEQELSQKSHIPLVKPPVSTSALTAAPLQRRVITQVAAVKPMAETIPPNPKTVESLTPKTASLSRMLQTAERSAPARAWTSAANQGSFAYRMNGDAAVYDGPNGQVVDTWEDRRSFTAAEPSEGWIKITGYFVNRIWKSAGAKERLWVKEGDVIRR